MLFYVLVGVAAASVTAWAYLLFFRGRFWRADQRLPAALAPRSWPAVAVVVPARDEAATIVPAVAALTAQDYRGEWRIILADDASQDGTAELARAASGGSPRLVASNVAEQLMKAVEHHRRNLPAEEKARHDRDALKQMVAQLEELSNLRDGPRRTKS